MKAGEEEREEEGERERKRGGGALDNNLHLQIVTVNDSWLESLSDVFMP